MMLDIQRFDPFITEEMKNSNQEAFVYRWYEESNDKYYMGTHKGTPDDKYTHSSTVWESFTKDDIPEGVTREIIAYGTDEEMYLLEHELLKYENESGNWDKYHNTSLGDPRYIDQFGENNPNYGKKHPEETLRKIREARKRQNGKNHPMWGKKHKPESIRKISEASKGRKHSEETRRKLSEARRGENHPMFGKKHTPEALRKMSEAKIGENHPMFGKKQSPESIRKREETKRRKREEAKMLKEVA